MFNLETGSVKVKQLKFDMPIELRSWEPRARVPSKIWAEKLKQAVEKNEIETVCFEVAPKKNCEFTQPLPPEPPIPENPKAPTDTPAPPNH